MPAWLSILLIFGIILALSGLFVAYKNRRETRLARESDSLSDWLVWGTGVLGLVVALLDWFILQSQEFNIGYLVAGGVFLLAGMTIRFVSRQTLGSYYSPRLCILAGHRLVTHGIYAIIRHPGYLGFILLAFGVCLIFGSLYGLIVMILAFLPALLFRITREETLLLAHFGEDYENYRKRTKKLIPLIY